MLNTFKNILAVLDQALPDPLGEFPQGFGITIGVIQDEKTLHAGSFYQEMALNPRTLRNRLPVGDRCGAADHNPSAHLQMFQHCIADRSSCVVVIYVNTFRAGFSQRQIKIIRFVINRCVIAKFITTYPCFFRPTRDTDRAATFYFSGIVNEIKSTEARRVFANILPVETAHFTTYKNVLAALKGESQFQPAINGALFEELTSGL